MTNKNFPELYLRELKKLKEELSLYKNERDLWIVHGDAKNSPGNLTLHLIGNLNHFIGATLGNTGYIRDRNKEFAEKNIPREKLLIAIDETVSMLKIIFSELSEDKLNAPFPIDFLGKRYQTDEMIFIFFGHLNYHLGQINYHRRLLQM